MPASFFSLHSSVLLPALPDCPPQKHEPILALRVGAAVVPVALTATPVAPGCAARPDGGTCPQDWTKNEEIENGDCVGDSMEYELEYQDDPYGIGLTLEDSGESSLQNVACIDGHNVCGSQCQFLHSEVISPPYPNSYVENDGDDGFGGTNGYIWWDWDSDEIYAQDQCNPEVENCWTDVTEQYVSGDSSEYYWDCAPSVQEAPSPRVASAPKKGGRES